MGTRCCSLENRLSMLLLNPGPLDTFTCKTRRNSDALSSFRLQHPPVNWPLSCELLEAEPAVCCMASMQARDNAHINDTSAVLLVCKKKWFTTLPSFQIGKSTPYLTLMSLAHPCVHACTLSVCLVIDKFGLVRSSSAELTSLLNHVFLVQNAP